MRMEDIRKLTRATPFMPFRVFLTNGEAHDIWHPDMIAVSLGAATVCVSSPGRPADQPDEQILVSLVHIVKIEQLPAPRRVSYAELAA
jgi:hypothetical protein